MSNENFIFEQDCAKCHSTIKVYDCLNHNVPHYTSTLHSRNGLKFYFPPVMDDFWSRERVWAEIANKVYTPPLPKDVNELMARVHAAHQSLTPAFLTKICHAMHARINQIYVNKGEKLHPTFRASETKWACKCEICSN